MSSVCYDNCGGGAHGFCNETAAICQCEYPWVNMGDLVPSPSLGCDVNFDLGKVFWILVLVINGILLSTLIFSIVSIQRATKKREFLELAMLINISIAICFHLITAGLEISAKYPGDRSIGLDLLTTICFVLGELGLMIHVMCLPLVQSGTSVLPFAVEASPTFKPRKNLLKLVVAVLVIGLLVAHILMLFIISRPDLVMPFISASMTLFFVAIFGSGLITFILVQSLIDKVAFLMSTSGKEMSDAQKSGLEKTRKRATGTKHLSMLTMFVYAPQFLFFAAAPQFMLKAAWFWIPLKRVIVALFDFRHPYLSLTTSHSHKGREGGSKNTTEEGEKDDQVSELKSSVAFLVGSTINKKKKKKLLTRVEEERTVDIMTETEQTMVVPASRLSSD